jgi:hypothetical protein
MVVTMPKDPSSSEPRVRSGVCHVIIVHDVAPYIDLQRLEQRIAADSHRQKITKKRRALEYFEFRPAPLVMTMAAEEISVGHFRSRPSVEFVIYDFGAITVSYTIPFVGTLGELRELSERIYDSADMQTGARRLTENFADVLHDAVALFSIAKVIEDYVIFHVEEFEGDVAPGDLVAKHASQVGQILRAEPELFSEQESRDAVAASIAFGKSDIAILDWNAALLYGREVDDLRTVVEFANVQLLELRFLDRQLDAALEESYAIVSQRGGKWRSWLRSYRADVRRIARMQVDGAILFERVSNALKVFGEEYLSRVYALTAERLQLAAWDASALRKLGTIESIYGKLTDEAATRRLEILEWIIVLLIAISIVLPWFT